MRNLYESIVSLCRERGITGAKMCTDLNFSKSLLTDLKMGRKKDITTETAQRIADYFGVSIDRVVGKDPAAQKKEQPAKGEPSPIDLEISKIVNQLPPERQAQALDYLHYLLAQQAAADN